ncbi:MAG: hypothetical protein GF416_07480 [Candidatus Altiarchaeales archaeon]|nr:hypothetical protein [Candidatus Altiarchaeales archaeon]MBD3416953.1 hypothetical protein [Candidatus Altiarchaeales archaeon]
MIDVLKKIDETLPLWEVVIIAVALFVIVVVLILWWAFGYNLVVVTEQPESVEAVALAAPLLKAL